MWILDELWQRRSWDKTAFVYDREQVSFQNLWQRSEALAGYLTANFSPALAAKTPVVLYGAKEINMVVGMHAALKCGVPYVPVDTLYPVERLQQIISQVGAKVVVNLSGRSLEGSFTVLNQKQLDDVFCTYAAYVSEKNKWVQDQDVCYILFTSGSTGHPKGVQIAKNNILCFVNWYKDFCPVRAETVCLNQVSYSFDVSVIPLYIYLAQGATLFNIDGKMLGDFKVMEQQLALSSLTDWVSTPALFDICLYSRNFNRELLPKLRRFTFAGEILTKKLVQEVHQRFGEATVVINGYGPTETTVLLTACQVTPAMMAAKANIPIGYLNPSLQHSLVQGELNVWGASVGCGYFHNPEQTAKNFFTAPDGSNGYRTGDLVTEEGGLLYFQDRKDFQLKLNGYRIEPDDISNNINKMPQVRNSVVLPWIQEGKVQYLAAFVQLKVKIQPSSSLKTAIAIKKFLKMVVPVYMIPKKIVILEHFPVNVNGKIDRKKLLEDLQ